jgi:hypothetical protein
VSTAGRRLSDWLNDHNVERIDLEEACYEELLAPEGEPLQCSHLTVIKAWVQVALPMDQPNIGARVETQRVPITLGCSLFSINGSLHRRSTDPRQLGSLLGGYARQFVPVSQAQIRYLPNGRFDEPASAVLVNTREIRFWAQ